MLGFAKAHGVGNAKQKMALADQEFSLNYVIWQRHPHYPTYCAS